MKKFVPYYDGVLDQLLPGDQLVPYQVGWAEYVELPPAFKKLVVKKPNRKIIPGEAPVDHRSALPTGLPDQR
jgi:hypothetical protein